MNFDPPKAPLERLQKVFNKVFHIPIQFITYETSMQNLPVWDSMRHLELMMAIESEFAIEFEILEIAELVSIEKIIESLKTHEAS